MTAYDRAYYEELRPAGGPAARVDDLRDRLVARLVHASVRNGRVLDVGCGRGDLLARLGDGYALHGMELSAAGLTLAHGRVPHATLAAGDIQDGVPFDGPFDAVTAVNVLEHLDRPDDALGHLAAAQPAGGVLVVHLPTIGNRVQLRRYTGSYDRDPTHVWRPSAAEVRSRIESAGYRHLRSAFAPFLPMTLWRHIPWQPAWLAVFERRR